MKFSILLPTRNRLDLLKYSIESVLRQNYTDWEIIVSDNDSAENIEDYISSLNDKRIHYYRTNHLVPVTDNWNNALYKSSGDYIIMLGDDDCLMKESLTKAANLIENYSNPDFIYSSSFLYAYPGVIPEFPDGFLNTYSYAEFFADHKSPFWLDKKSAKKMTFASLNFKVLFGYNMQFFIISRKFIESLSDKGKFFQSPYPDYYASNVIFLEANSILINPEPLTTIGISPKSFGYYYFNDNETEGVQFLQNIPDGIVEERIKNILLPGTNMNTSWLMAMETIKLHYGDKYILNVNYRRYRFLQFLQMVGPKSNMQISMIVKLMTLTEKIIYYPVVIILGVIKRLNSKLYSYIYNKLYAFFSPYPKYKPINVDGNFMNILDVFENVNVSEYK